MPHHIAAHLHVKCIVVLNVSEHASPTKDTGKHCGWNCFRLIYHTGML